MPEKFPCKTSTRRRRSDGKSGCHHTESRVHLVIYGAQLVRSSNKRAEAGCAQQRFNPPFTTRRHIREHFAGTRPRLILATAEHRVDPQPRLGAAATDTRPELQAQRGAETHLYEYEYMSIGQGYHFGLFDPLLTPRRPLKLQQPSLPCHSGDGPVPSLCLMLCAVRHVI